MTSTDGAITPPLVRPRYPKFEVTGGRVVPAFQGLPGPGSVTVNVHSLRENARLMARTPRYAAMVALTVILTSGLAVITQAPSVANAVITQTSVPLMEFVNDGAAGRAWNAYNQTVNSGGPAVAGRPSPIEYGITVHVYARAANGDLMEFINDDAGHRLWNAYDLTQITQRADHRSRPRRRLLRAQRARLRRGPQRRPHRVHQRHAGGRLWNAYDLTAAAGGPTLGGDATPLVNGSSDWVFARASDGDLVEF